MTALGIRENNPLNLIYRPQDQWAGLANPPQVEGKCAFLDAPHAFRAYTIQLKHYLARGIDTVPKIIKLWSQTDQAAYTVNVLRWGHFQAMQVLTEADFPALFAAMCRQEDGSDPYPDSVIAEGISMALDTTPAKTIMTVTPTIAVAGAGGISFAITSLLVGAFHDFAHIDISADRQVALALIIGVLIHHFFPKGEPAQG